MSKMPKSKREIKFCLLRDAGTNCDAEVQAAFASVGVDARTVHISQFEKGRDNLEEYNGLFIPGGFTHGDYVRAGAMTGARLRTRLRGQIERFVEAGKPIGSVCNGFQILVEAGMLPGDGYGGMTDMPTAALMTNDSGHYECRPVYVKRNKGDGIMFARFYAPGKPQLFPIGHGEGKFVLPQGKEEEIFAEMEERGQILWRYCRPDGDDALRQYPHNPNGSYRDVAGIQNGPIFGMMPHPERNAFGWQVYSENRRRKESDGMRFFRALKAAAKA